MVRKTLLERIKETDGGLGIILKMIVVKVDELTDRIVKLEEEIK